MQQLPAAASSRIVTLRRVWADYQQTRQLKPLTVRNYNQRLTQHLSDWLDIPITAITKDMVEQRHRSIHGDAMANSTMRTLRALFIYAGYKYEDDDGSPLVKSNPVRRLSEVKAWRRDRRRKTCIHPPQFRDWFRAVFSLQNSTMRDIFLVAILTGMRKSEILNLRWADVNLETGTIELRDTKNGDSFSVPLSDYVRNLLSIRKMGALSEFVFPGYRKDRPIAGLDKACAEITKRSGVKFCLHDCRRTFVTSGDDLDLKTEVVKALVNHRSSDVTEGYTCRSIERLRRATQRITHYILLHAGIIQPKY